MVKLNSEMKAGTDAATVTDVQVNHVSQTIAKPNVIRRLSDDEKLKIAWVILEWVGYERGFEFDDNNVLDALRQNGV